MTEAYDSFLQTIEEKKQKNEAARRIGTDSIISVAEKYGLKVHWFTPYHARIWRKDMAERFDYFPVSGKTVFGKKRSIVHAKSIEEFTVNIFHL